MSATGGVFGVARSVWDHPCFKSETFTETQAWLWLLSEAKWQDGNYKTHAGQVFLSRGELCHSERFMAKKFGWAKSKVNRFLTKLMRHDMLDRTKRRQSGTTSDQKRTTNRGGDRTTYQVFAIRNYNAFQSVGLPNRTTPKTESGTTSDQKRTELKEGRSNYINGEPQAAPLDGPQKSWVWTEGLTKLQSLNLGEPEARKLIGRWLSTKSKPVATEDMLRRAILAAEAKGTGDPVPFITAILKNESDGGVRRDGEEWIIPHGSDEYAAHAKHARIGNSPDIYRWPDTPGHEARAKSRWPNSAEIVNFRQEARA